uniref:Metalloendopeptidase n=1 Tax=Poecilia reticulata TaxID=8081 RepID=A0A3P9PJN6_POERE
MYGCVFKVPNANTVNLVNALGFIELSVKGDLCMNCNTFLLTGSAGMLLEGDVYIPKTRTAMKGIVEIPFVITLLSATVDNTEKSKILLAIKGFEGKTCIQSHNPLHALVFYHKHTRSDRDQFVKVHWENIKECKKNLHDHSIMYTSFVFLDNLVFIWHQQMGAVTIKPIPDPNVPIGQQCLSDIDILRVNKLYKCRSYLG